MFDPNDKEVTNFEWTIKVRHGAHELTMHSIAELANFLLFPYMVRAKDMAEPEKLPRSISDGAYCLMRALRCHTGASLKDLRDFIMGERRLPLQEVAPIE